MSTFYTFEHDQETLRHPMEQADAPDLEGAAAEEPLTEPPPLFFEQNSAPEDQGDDGGNVYHIYVMKEPQRGEPPVVEQAQATPPSPPEVQARRHKLLTLALAWLLVAAMLSGVAAAYLLQPPTAMITIIPQTTPISMSTTIEVVTAGAASGTTQGQVPGRMLPTMTLSQAMRVPTSGSGHQNAQAAHGLVTFYNALPEPQRIPAGTLLTGADGIEMVTDQDAVLAGPAGNIRAGDLSGPCCREDVLVENAAFTGGQNARDFPMVRRQDVESAAATLRSSLQQSVQAAMQEQVHPGETLVGGLSCHEGVSSDHQIGEEATQVMVTESETCSGATYDTAGMKRALTRMLAQAARERLGSDYTLAGEVQVSMLHAAVEQEHQGVLELQVKASANYVYQFTEAGLAQVKQLIAGKSKEEATRLLLGQAGVSSVSLQVKGRETSMLPTDPAQIQVLVLSPSYQ